MTLTYEQKVFIWASGHFLANEVDQYFFIWMMMLNLSI